MKANIARKEAATGSYTNIHQTYDVSLLPSFFVAVITFFSFFDNFL